MSDPYPDDIDLFSTIPAGTRQADAVGGRTHRQIHNDVGDAVEALEAQLGVRGSGLALLDPVANLGLDIWQVGTSFSTVADGTWTADNWVYRKAGGGAHDILRSTDVPTVAAAKYRASYSLHLDVTGNDAAIASGDLYAIATRMEGYQWRTFDQQLWSIGFWVKAAKAGRHYVYATNGGSDRSAVSAYDIAVADTWEYHQALFPANPTAGTWNYDTGRGIEIGWCLAAGSTYQASAAQTWETGFLTCMADQVNELDSTANNFRIAMVGRPTLGSSPAIYRPTAFEFALWRARQYYEKSYDYATAPGSVATIGEVIGQASNAIAASTAGFLQLPVAPLFTAAKRVAPTVVIYGISPATANAILTAGGTRTGVTSSGPSQVRPWDQLSVDNTSTTAITDRVLVQLQWTASARIP